MRFARAVVDMRSDLISNKFGVPEEPDILPSALESFLSMSEDCQDQWPFANLTAVYNYLRGSKHLRVPLNWEPYLPKRM